jgi:hypothetical protein
MARAGNRLLGRSWGRFPGHVLEVVQEPRDRKTYDIHFDPAKLRMH